MPKFNQAKLMTGVAAESTAEDNALLEALLFAGPVAKLSVVLPVSAASTAEALKRARDCRAHSSLSVLWSAKNASEYHETLVHRKECEGQHEEEVVRLPNRAVQQAGVAVVAAHDHVALGTIERAQRELQMSLLEEEPGVKPLILP